MTDPVKFWIEDPSILFTDVALLPTSEMSRNAKLNAATRLAILVATVLYVIESEYSLNFLMASILLIIVLGYGMNQKTFSPGKEGFSIVPTRVGDDFEQVIVAPTFAEEHRVPPPAYDHYSNAEIISPPFAEPIRPQAYPYGQYLTRTNLLPSDEYAMHMNPSGGSRTAREYQNGNFMKHDIAFKENMTNVFKKTLERRFRHGGVVGETFSPYHSY